MWRSYIDKTLLMRNRNSKWSRLNRKVGKHRKAVDWKSERTIRRRMVIWVKQDSRQAKSEKQNWVCPWFLLFMCTQLNCNRLPHSDFQHTKYQAKNSTLQRFKMFFQPEVISRLAALSRWIFCKKPMRAARSLRSNRIVEHDLLGNYWWFKKPAS